MKRFETRISKELHEKLRQESFDTRKSMNEIVTELIENKYKGEKTMKTIFELKREEKQLEVYTNDDGKIQVEELETIDMYDIENFVEDFMKEFDLDEKNIVRKGFEIKEDKKMLGLIEKDHGEERELFEGNLEEVVTHLKENNNIYSWILEEDADMKMPEFENIENLRDLKVELKKIDLSWWTLELEKIYLR